MRTLKRICTSLLRGIWILFPLLGLACVMAAFAIWDNFTTANEEKVILMWITFGYLAGFIAWCMTRGESKNRRRQPSLEPSWSNYWDRVRYREAIDAPPKHMEGADHDPIGLFFDP